MKTLKFTKEEGIWFINLRWWPGPKWCLAMIAGADKLLDILSKGNDKVTLKVSKFKIKKYDEAIVRNEKLGLLQGATYNTTKNKLEYYGFGRNTLWLCSTTLFVYGWYPNQLYIKIVKNV